MLKYYALIVVILTLFGVGCGQKDQWMSFYYPDADDLSEVIISPSPLESLEKCRELVKFNKRSFNPEGDKRDDYECGKNCKLQDAELNLYVCEETVE